MVIRFRYQEVLLAIFLAVVMVRNLPFSPWEVTDPAEAAESGGLAKQLLFVGFFIAMSLPLVRVKLRDLPISLPIILLLLFGALSMTWSAVPLIAIRRLALTALITLTLLSATAQLRPKNILAVVRLGTLGLCLATIVSGLVIPKLAIHQPGDIEQGLIGCWRGVFPHKNSAGVVAGLALVLSAEAFLRSPRRIASGLASMGLASVTLYLTLSKTSIVASVLAILVLLAFRTIVAVEGRNKARATLLRVAIVIAGVNVLLIAWFTSGIAQYILDPQAFTGRGEIWGVITDLVNKRPLLGYGYQSVFLAGDQSVLGQVTTGWIQRMPNSHNGILDLLVTIGVVGTVLYVWAMLIDPWHRLRKLPDSVRTDWEPVFAGLTTYTLIHSLMEGNMFFGQAVDWVVLVLLVGIVLRLSAVVAEPSMQPRKVAV